MYYTFGKHAKRLITHLISAAGHHQWTKEGRKTPFLVGASFARRRQTRYSTLSLLDDFFQVWCVPHGRLLRRPRRPTTKLLPPHLLEEEEELPEDDWVSVSSSGKTFRCVRSLIFNFYDLIVIGNYSAAASGSTDDDHLAHHHQRRREEEQHEEEEEHADEEGAASSSSRRQPLPPTTTTLSLRLGDLVCVTRETKGKMKQEGRGIHLMTPRDAI